MRLDDLRLRPQGSGRLRRPHGAQQVAAFGSVARDQARSPTVTWISWWILPPAQRVCWSASP